MRTWAGIPRAQKEGAIPVGAQTVYWMQQLGPSAFAETQSSLRTFVGADNRRAQVSASRCKGKRRLPHTPGCILANTAAAIPDAAAPQ